MHQSTRQAEMLELLQAQGLGSIAELAERFGVSEETIRRDIRQLELTGQVQKVHGGVRLQSRDLEPAYQLRIAQQAAEKRRIAARAAELVRDGMTVLIDSGTTSFWLAKALGGVRNLTIVTNAVEVAREMAGRNHARVFLAGGEVDEEYHSCFGPEARGFMSRFTPEVAFFSIGAIDADFGYLDFHLAEGELKRDLAPLARKVVLLADASKFGRSGLVRVFDFTTVDILVTDAPPPKIFAEALAATEVIVAERPSGVVAVADS